VASNSPFAPLSDVGLRQLVELQLHLTEVKDRYAHRSDPVARIWSIIILDYVTESLLKTVAQSLGLEKKAKQEKIGELWKDVDAALGKRSDLRIHALPLSRELMALHDSRNLTQHAADIPSAETVAKGMAFVSSFFVTVAEELYGCSPDKLRLSSLVQDDDVRGFLDESEKALANGNPREAITSAKLAFDLALRNSPVANLLKSGVSTRPVSLPRVPARSQMTREVEGVAAFVVEVAKYFDARATAVQEQLFISSIGLDYMEHVLFSELSPFVSWMGTGSRHQVRIKRMLYSKEEAEFVFGYALRAALQIQALHSPAIPQRPAKPEHIA
jgi:hypothetical protein